MDRRAHGVADPPKSARLPSVASYLSKLPAGLASYPECRVKASVLRNMLSDRSLGPEVALPPEVRALADEPPPVTSWISEVHFNALALAVRDVHFPGDDLDGYLKWALERNRRLLSTPLYRAVFLLISPERLLNGIGRRWATFRTGTELRLHSHSTSSGDLRLVTPPFLEPLLAIQGLTLAFQAALERSGAKEPRGEAEVLSSTETAFRFTWR